ncbi:cystathionine gamma-synthase [Maribellus comscasis]|uniref:Cystathionine gamma-synthase n=1 Tax=Maribellus comscasis TaxID=2681766 RepID=A0A6I6K000_9BACT|nr:cystathionine gamma-synthase [Maribellus comscasis]QGY45857.1 cystathionine gamma-synthase [Maribellus comscasis]
MKFSTKTIHAGQRADKATGAVVVPIYQTSTYKQDELNVHKGFEYSRTGNPTRQALEECLAALEDGRFGLAFSSGLAAEHAVLSTLKPGDHVIAAEDMYGGTYRLFEQVFKPFGLRFSYVGGSVRDFENAITAETKLFWIESPTNPLLRIADISAVSAIAHGKNIKVVVDNTFASPYFQQPLALGADLVVHSTTKYIGGHSDIVGGALIVNDEAWHDRLKFLQNAVGAIPGAFDSWLALRGLKTLSVRMKQHEENAHKIAEFLENHPSVTQVYYPGLSSDRFHLLAKQQMNGFGGMVSFKLKNGDEKSVNYFLKNLKIISLAESLGGVESLICYPAAMTHGSIPEKKRNAIGVSNDLVRLSAGIENVEDLIEDLAQSLDYFEKELR